MRSLEEVLKDLKDAEKEYADKCLQYGIQEKKRSKKTEADGQTNTSENGVEPSQDPVQEVSNSDKQ